MRELILQSGINFDNLPLVTRTLRGPSDDLERILVVHNNDRITAWLSTSKEIVELLAGEDLCYRFHISCALWFGIPREDFEMQLRDKLSELCQLAELANYPSKYLSICIRNDMKDCHGYTACNEYYGLDRNYPINIYDYRYEDEEGMHHFAK